jgi:hypothetical protein
MSRRIHPMYALGAVAVALAAIWAGVRRDAVVGAAANRCSAWVGGADGVGAGACLRTLRACAVPNTADVPA